jgi:hypothetical protein
MDATTETSGGKLESLIVAGERFGTTNPDVATRLASGWLAEI